MRRIVSYCLAFFLLTSVVSCIQSQGIVQPETPVKTIPLDSLAMKASLLPRDYRYRLTNATVTKRGRGFAFIEDESGAIKIESGTLDLEEGQTINGEVKLTLVLRSRDNADYAAITYLDLQKAKIKTTGGISPLPMTISDLLAHFDRQLHRYVKFNGVHIDSGVSELKQKGSVSQKSENLIIYNEEFNAEIKSGQTGTLCGFPAYRNGIPVLLIFESGQFREVPEHSDDDGFTATTIPGIYDIHDVEHPAGIWTYRDFIDQMSYSTGDYISEFSLLDIESGKAFRIITEMEIPLCGQNYPATFLSIGETGAIEEKHELRLAARSDTMLWFKDDANGKGFIVRR